MITVVFAKPRAGKTAYLVANMSRFMNRSEDDLELHQCCCNEISRINATSEFQFDLPHHSPVYSNFQTCFQVGYKKYVSSYYMDGFHLGFENPYVDVLPVLPFGKIFLSEAQRYYDSSHKQLARWVSGWYEEHGHFDLDVWLDTQRPILIHKNIRELVNCFVYVDSMHNFTDKMGNIVASRWGLKEFEDWKYAEAFIDSGDTKHCIERTFDYVGNVFEHYESQCYREQFIPIKGQFSMQQHLQSVRNESELRNLKFMYSQTAPKNYWPDEIDKKVRIAI